MATPIASYRNGNYVVKLYSDGTKIKKTNADYFDAEFPDSMDIKITNKCDMNCPMCHEQSVPDGEEANLLHPLFDTINRGTEIALGGGNPLSHPNLVPFLTRMKKRGVICNVTVNEVHLLQNMGLIEKLLKAKLIRGLGVSLNNYDQATIDFFNRTPNAVAHVIAGIITESQIKILEANNIKTLILGYKRFGRGINFYSLAVADNICMLKDRLKKMTQTIGVVSFDNLALSQLDVKSLVTQEEYEQFYMGDDGEATMYIDAVKEEFAVSSTSIERYPVTNDVIAMFQSIKKNNR